MKPNLFTLATQELSQDAFIAWLLQWADPECQGHNPELHEVAIDFVGRLISLQGSAPEEITRVKAGRQRKNIDVWAEINDSHLIIIEDKVGNGRHSNQLEKYKKFAKEWCRKEDRKLTCIYMKTESESRSRQREVVERGYAIFDRPLFLSLLESRDVQNDIYSDYRDRLREMEDRESQFSDKPVGEWNDHDWKGFYRLLEDSRPVLNWGYVPNPSGGLWDAVLNWYQLREHHPFMQIAQGDLCFKIGKVYQERSSVRRQFHQLLMENGGIEKGLQRPGRFGTGTYMTGAVVPRAEWLGGDNEMLDLTATVDRLNHYETWFAGVIENTPQPEETETAS